MTGQGGILIPLRHGESEANAAGVFVAHGNSLRALVALLDHLDAPAIRALNIPTAEPLGAEYNRLIEIAAAEPSPRVRTEPLTPGRGVSAG